MDESEIQMEIREGIAYYRQNFRAETDALIDALAVSTHPLAKASLVAGWGSIDLHTFPFTQRVRWTDHIRKVDSSVQSTKEFTETQWLADFQLFESEVRKLDEAGIIKPTGCARRQLCFVSKYLHYAINPAWPVWDSYARWSMARWVERPSAQATWDSYVQWARLIQRFVEKYGRTLADESTGLDSLVRSADYALWGFRRKIIDQGGAA